MYPFDCDDGCTEGVRDRTGAWAFNVVSGFDTCSTGAIDKYRARRYLKLEETLHAVAIEPTRHAVLQTLPHNNRRPRAMVDHNDEKK